MQKPYDIKRTLRLPEKLAEMIEQIAELEGVSSNAITIEAMKRYADHYFLETENFYVSTEIINTIEALNRQMMDQFQRELSAKLNQRSNQLLSTIAINQYVIMRILIASTKPSPRLVEDFEKEGISFLQENNRVFRMSDLNEHFENKGD